MTPLLPRAACAAARLVFLAVLALGGCDMQLDNFDCDAVCGLDFGVHRTAVVVVPGSMDARAGDTVTAEVLVVNASDHAFYPRADKGYAYGFKSLTRDEPDEPGVTTGISLVSSQPCRTGEVPALILDRNIPEADYVCTRLLLTVSTLSSTLAVASVNLKATFQMVGYNSETRPVTPTDFTQSGAFLLRLATPSFDLAVVPLGKVHATRGFVSVQVTRHLGFAADVTLTFEAPLGSGITGTFLPSPVVAAGVDRVQLQLDLPAHTAAGYFGLFKVLGSSGGIDRSLTFPQLVEPLYTVKVATADGGPAVLTPTRPLDLDVTIEFDPFGPFSLIGPGRIELSLPDPPPGVVASFLPDAQPSSIDPAALVLRRTLRLSGPREASMDDLRVRATAAQLPPDTVGVQPFIEAKLSLRIDPALSWDYVNSGAAYFLNANDVIGIAMQSNNQPAIAWLEGPVGSNKEVFLKRFDGTTFAPSPSPGGPGSGLSVSGGRIEQARMAMSGNGDAHVAFTYKLNDQEGARVGYGLNRAGANWSTHDEIVFLPSAQHARSPRIAAGLNDALALSYIVETGIPPGAGALFVRSRLAAGALAALPGPQLDGSINVSTSGQVLRDTPSLALRVDGNPWLAWIEERFAPQVPLPPALWLRGHDGTRWGAPIAVPRLRPLVAAPTQLLVTPTGKLIVAWLEALAGSPARLMLASVDPVTGVATELRDSINPDGALNTTTDEPARDMALTFDVRGRLVVTWTEGLTRPQLYAKRLNANGSWDRLGTAIDAFRPTRSPFVTSDGSGRLYVAWTGFFLGTDLNSPLPRTDVLVGRWIFTEDFAR